MVAVARAAASFPGHIEMTFLRFLTVAAATLAAACALPGTAGAAPRSTCARSGYSYGGLQTLVAARGLSARVTAVAAPAVTSGHVAAWVGVSGASGWAQIGVSVLPDGTTELYAESSLPGRAVDYESLGPVAAGGTHRVGVLETSPDTWIVLLDDVAVSGPFVLPGTHGTARPMATTESFDGGATACNAYGFRFSDLQSAASGTWQPLRTMRAFSDVGIVLRTPSSSAVVVTRR